MLVETEALSYNRQISSDNEEDNNISLALMFRVCTFDDMQLTVGIFLVPNPTIVDVLDILQM